MAAESDLHARADQLRSGLGEMAEVGRLLREGVGEWTARVERLTGAVADKADQSQVDEVARHLESRCAAVPLEAGV